MAALTSGSFAAVFHQASTALPEFLQPAFMQRAVIAAVLVGLAAPAIGTYLVQRRMALMGDGIGHVREAVQLVDRDPERAAESLPVRIREGRAHLGQSGGDL